MNKTVVELQNLRKTYGSFAALEDLSISIQRGEFVVLLGPSGSGKTTLLSILGGFTQPTSGKVLIDGQDVTFMPPAQRPTVTVFQDYALFPHMTVRDNVAFGPAMRRKPRAECVRLAERALGTVGLSGFEGRRIHEISGGQRQRVALARAIVIEPTVLLLDEPLGALDVKIRRQMQDELVKLQRSLGATFIHVTHDQEEAMSIADKVVLLNKGKIEDMGPPERVYRQPASMFAATFMGDTNILKGVVSSAANGVVTVETSVGTIRTDGEARVGRDVHLSIRPETLHVGKARTHDCVSLGKGFLQDVVYQGAYRRSRIIVGGASPTSLLVHLPVDFPVAQGAETAVWVKPSDIALVK